MDVRKNFASLESQSSAHAEIRKAALEQFEKLGVPTRKNDDWKYTPAEKWLRSELELPNWSAEAASVDSGLAEFEHTLFFVDGEYQDALSVLPAGVKIKSLRRNPEALSHHSETFYREMKIDSFFHLNEAFTNDGVVIEIGRDQIVEGVLEIIHLSSDGKFVPARNLIKCGPLSQVTIVERFVSQGAEYHFSNVISEIFADAGAVVRYAQVQEENLAAFHVGHVNVMQNANSNVEVLTVSLGGGLTRFNVNSRLLGEGAFSKVNSLYLVEKEQHTDLCSVIDHAVPHCESSQLAKGILTDAGRAVFNGVVKVRKDAQKSNSEQLNKNLVLDTRAEVDTRPQLQIDADDVKAAHGATVGQLDPEELFYLQSRAIERESAIRILGLGFADEVIYQFSNDEVRDVLLRKTRQKFEGFQL